MAANSTALPSASSLSSSSDVESVASDTKNKRQVDQYLRTPGASASTAIGSEGGPQAFPLQLSHGIYSQSRLPLYTRRPTTISKPQVTEENVEQEPQQQQQVGYKFA